MGKFYTGAWQNKPWEECIATIMIDHVHARCMSANKGEKTMQGHRSGRFSHRNLKRPLRIKTTFAARRSESILNQFSTEKWDKLPLQKSRSQRSVQFCPKQQCVIGRQRRKGNRKRRRNLICSIIESCLTPCDYDDDAMKERCALWHWIARASSSVVQRGRVFQFPGGRGRKARSV